jgi:Arc/MetJ family transcription regulator
MGTVRMARVNLMIDKASVGELRKLLGTHSDSETVRAAVQHRLASLRALDALRSLQGIGKLEDVFRRDVVSKG